MSRRLKAIADVGSAWSGVSLGLLRFAHKESRSGLVHGLFAEHVWRYDGNGAIRHGGKRGKT
jgi:hypothetical protein